MYVQLVITLFGSVIRRAWCRSVGVD